MKQTNTNIEKTALCLFPIHAFWLKRKALGEMEASNNFDVFSLYIYDCLLFRHII